MAADEVKVRFMVLGGRHLVWAKRGELKEHFNIIAIDVETRMVGRHEIEDMYGELREGIIVELKAESSFEDLPHDVRYEVFLFKRMDKHGPAMFALEHTESIIGSIPDHLEESYGIVQ